MRGEPILKVRPDVATANDITFQDHDGQIVVGVGFRDPNDPNGYLYESEYEERWTTTGWDYGTMPTNPKKPIIHI